MINAVPGPHAGRHPPYSVKTPVRGHDDTRSITSLPRFNDTAERDIRACTFNYIIIYYMLDVLIYLGSMLMNRNDLRSTLLLNEKSGSIPADRLCLKYDDGASATTCMTNR